MTQLSPTAMEAAAKAAYDVPMSDGDPFGTLVYMSDYVHPGSLDDMRRSTMEILNTVAAAAITAYLAQREKEGWVMVPLNPTPAMIEAGCDNNPTQWNEGTDLGFAADVANDVYRAMLAQNGGE